VKELENEVDQVRVSLKEQRDRNKELEESETVLKQNLSKLVTQMVGQ